MSSQEVFQGYLEVKIPSRLLNLGLTPWKTWKRQWVVIRTTTGNDGLDIQIGKNGPSIRVSADGMLCRTESRTRKYAFAFFSHYPKRRPCLYLAGNSETDCQKWMAKFRKLLRTPLLPVEDNEFSVSIIENTFARACGLSGLYGTLNVSTDEVTVIDTSTSKVKVKWLWNMLGQFHVVLPELKEDDGHICVIQTTRNFPSGEGEIKLFCLESSSLVQRLLTRGRASSLLPSPSPRAMSQRHHTVTTRFPQQNELKQTPSSPVLNSYSLNRRLRRPLLFTRRISRSEGDLRACFEQIQKNQDLRDGSNMGSRDSVEKGSVGSDDSGSSYFLKWKIASSLISAGIGLMLPNSKRGQEEEPTTKQETYPEYQTVIGEECEDDDLGALNFTVPSYKYLPPRRESGISVASGVYEEIQDDLSFVQTLSPITYNIVCVDEDECVELPPPLPPRRCDTWRSISESEDSKHQSSCLPLPNLKYKSFSANNTPLPSPPNGYINNSYEKTSFPFKPEQRIWQNKIEESESHYIPMSPTTWKNESNYMPMSPKQKEESLYMPMASLHIV